MKLEFSLSDQRYRLRDMRRGDLTAGYIKWFNSSYVKCGLNLGNAPLTASDHLQHLESCKQTGSQLLVLSNAKDYALLSYIKVRPTTSPKAVAIDVAIDRILPDRHLLVRSATWHLSRELLEVQGVLKIQAKINKGNHAARMHMHGTEFKLEGILRKDVISNSGEAEDVYSYGLIKEDLTVSHDQVVYARNFQGGGQQ